MIMHHKNSMGKRDMHKDTPSEIAEKGKYYSSHKPGTYGYAAYRHPSDGKVALHPVGFNHDKNGKVSGINKREYAKVQKMHVAGVAKYNELNKPAEGQAAQ